MYCLRYKMFCCCLRTQKNTWKYFTEYISHLKNESELFPVLPVSPPESPEPVKNKIYVSIYKFNIQLSFQKLRPDIQETVQIVLETFLNKHNKQPYMFIVDYTKNYHYLPIYYVKNIGTSTIPANLSSEIYSELLDHTIKLPIDNYGTTMEFKFSLID